LSLIYKALSTIEEGEGVEYPESLVLDARGAESFKDKLVAAMRFVVPVVLVLVVTAAIVVAVDSRMAQTRFAGYSGQTTAPDTHKAPASEPGGDAAARSGSRAAADGESKQAASRTAVTAEAYDDPGPRPKSGAPAAAQTADADGGGDAAEFIFEPAYAGYGNPASARLTGRGAAYQAAAAAHSARGALYGGRYSDPGDAAADMPAGANRDAPGSRPDAPTTLDGQRPYSEVAVVDDARTSQVHALNAELNRAIRKRDLDRIDQTLNNLAILVGHGSAYMLKLRAFTELAIGGDNEYAMELLQKVLASDPNDHEAGINLAVAEINLGEMSSARQRLESLAAANPTDVRIDKLLRSIQ